MFQCHVRNMLTLALGKLLQYILIYLNSNGGYSQESNVLNTEI